MNGVSSNVIISCTHKGTHHLITMRGNITPMIVFYSPQAPHIIMSQNDTITTNWMFSTWTQHSNMDTGTGHLRFSSPSSLHSEHIDLSMNKNLWYCYTAFLTYAIFVSCIVSCVKHCEWNVLNGVLLKQWCVAKWPETWKCYISNLLSMHILLN